jgi:hypothetical protein
MNLSDLDLVLNLLASIGTILYTRNENFVEKNLTKIFHKNCLVQIKENKFENSYGNGLIQTHQNK